MNSHKALDRNAEHATEMKKFMEEAKKKFLKKYESKGSGKVDLSQYEHIQTLGSGSYGRVVLVQEKQSNEYFAMKIMSKRQVSKGHQIAHIVEEKRILFSVDFPLLIRLFGHGQDNSYIYLILEYINGGEMFTHLRKEKMFSESTSRFYASQVVLALEYLHGLDIVYRDLKPENILIDCKGNLKIIDMGFAKRIKTVAYTFCGTPEYIAPEILFNKGYNKSVDWYTLGVLIYEMMAGFSPFWAETQVQLYEKIIEGKLRFPSTFSTNVKSIISKLMHKDLTRRFGNLKGGVQDIKNHEWFTVINWQDMFKLEVAAPFLPKVKGAGDCQNFRTGQAPVLVVESTNQFGDLFDEF